MLKPFNLNKLSFIPLCFVMTFANTTHAKTETGFTEINDELEIMQQVLQTRLKQGDDELDIKLRRIDSTYLANQGALFTIETSSRRCCGNFNHGFEIDIEPFVEIGNIDWESHAEAIEEAMEIAREVQQMDFSDLADELRDLRSEAREKEWEIREVEREKRDLTFELNRAEKERQKEIERELAELKKLEKVTQTKQKTLSEKARKLDEQRKQKVEQRKQDQQKANESFIKVFELSIADSLCRFGAGFRTLPKDQHITFVLENFNATMSRARTSRYYVFPMESIKRCVQEKMDASELVAKATVYDF